MDMEHQHGASAENSDRCCHDCGCKNESFFEATRRQFLKVVVGIVALGWGVLTLIPVIRYLTPPKSEDAGEQISSINLGKVDSLAKGQGKNFQFGHKPAIIVRDEAGEFHAFSAVCTHLGCTVQYSDEKSNIWCACHGGQYDATTGKNIAGPPPKPLTPLYVSVVNNEIIVSKAPGNAPAAAAPEAATKES